MLTGYEARRVDRIRGNSSEDRGSGRPRARFDWEATARKGNRRVGEDACPPCRGRGTEMLPRTVVLASGPVAVVTACLSSRHRFLCRSRAAEAPRKPCSKGARGSPPGPAAPAPRAAGPCFLTGDSHLGGLSAVQPHTKIRCGLRVPWTKTLPPGVTEMTSQKLRAKARPRLWTRPSSVLPRGDGAGSGSGRSGECQRAHGGPAPGLAPPCVGV